MKCPAKLSPLWVRTKSEALATGQGWVLKVGVLDCQVLQAFKGSLQIFVAGCHHIAITLETTVSHPLMQVQVDRSHHEGRDLLNSLSHNIEGSACQDAVQFAVNEGACSGGAQEMEMLRVRVSARVSGM